jgi:PTS system nitrogen regulatory IIA component
MFNVSEKTVYRWINQQDIPFYKLNDQYRFNRIELIEWATSHRIQASPRILLEQESSDMPPARLDDALKAGGIYYRVCGADKKTVMKNVVELIRLPEEMDRKAFWEALLLREELASTGIGDGIAIPHVRGPIILQVSKPTIALCFLEKPVDFNALDGKPINILFVLVSPTVRSHLQLLSRLSFALQDREFREAIKQQRSREKILDAAYFVEETIRKRNLAAEEGKE